MSGLEWALSGLGQAFSGLYKGPLGPEIATLWSVMVPSGQCLFLSCMEMALAVLG